MSIPHTELSRMLETAVVAARLAGQRAMEELRYIRKSLKNNSELVTQADPVCQKIIIDRICETYPDHGFIAEEGKDGHLLRRMPRGDESIWWVIDPIDGTNNFANSLLCFCVSIAAMLDGKPILGVIFDPTTDSMVTAALDMDAQLNSSTITVSEDGIGPYASFAVDSHLNARTNHGAAEMMRQTRFRCMGSTALHLAYVAKGAMIGMVATSTKLWDIAAGAIIIERAGGVVTDIDGGSLFPVSLKDYNAEYFGILATNKKIHDQTLKIFA
ncbi:MAG: inositol monophosphatase [Phycisphaerae bacterium]|nr:inositol monophosphatase [Phycisphaerae bacterium]